MRDDGGEVKGRAIVVNTTCVLTSGGAAGFSWVSEAIDPCCDFQVRPEARVDCLVLAKDSRSTRRGDLGCQDSRALIGRGVRVEQPSAERRHS